MGKQENILGTLSDNVIVSCQPVVDGPMDNTIMVTAMALAAQNGGAAGLRLESIASVRSVSQAANLPIIGIVKRDLSDSPVRITPFIEDVEGLADAGAGIIAYDATQRDRPVPTAEIVRRINDLGMLAMADCARLDDGRQALDEGAQILGTTLSGYAYDLQPEQAPPDLALVQEFAALGAFVIAEGRFRTPGETGEAIKCGANSIVVGSAITRIEVVTGWFSDAIKNAST